jgi:type IV secretion system protein VirB9
VKVTKTFFGLAVGGAVMILTGCETVQGWFESEPPPPSQTVVFNAAARPGSEDESREDVAVGDTLAGADGAEQVVVDVVEFEWPEGAEADESNLQELGPEDAVDAGTARYTVNPSERTFQGGAVVYNYVSNNIYRVFTQPLRTTDIQLQPGEQLVSPPAAGDTSNFVVGTSQSYVEGTVREHVIVKPLYPDMETTLNINTDKRSYHFMIRSFDSTFMPIVAFNYPMETFAEMERQAQRRAQRVPVMGDITQLDFNYEIVPMSVHRPAWMPSRVFSDGHKTYLFFPSARRAAYAPVLFSVESGERELLNYRVAGSYYIVDRVVQTAELVVDVNTGNIVTIRRIDS